MRKRIIRVVQKLSKAISAILYTNRPGRLIVDDIASSSMERIVSVEHNSNTFKFTCPNYLNRWRLKTFATKEPEMLDWIESIESGSVVWDIGANIGLYSIYAAKIKNCQVFSFEPSVFNLELLARNIWLNDLSNNITIVPPPLTSSVGFNKLHMSSTSWGGAISTFGSDAIGHDGKLMDKKFEFKTLGVSMDSAVNLLKIPKPDYIKMDVDGIEHIILSGGENVLSGIKEIIIEINDDFEEQSLSASRLLTKAGLKIKVKTHSEIIDKIEGFNKTFNQIWVRNL